MLGIKFQDRTHSHPYVYRLNIECLGKSLEFGISFQELGDLAETGRKITKEPTRLASHLKALREKWKANEHPRDLTTRRKVLRRVKAEADV